jgi:hypothetical protein
MEIYKKKYKSSMQKERLREGMCTNLIHRSSSTPASFRSWGVGIFMGRFIGFPEWNSVYTLSVTDLLSEAMEQKPSRKSNGHSASQTIPRISGNHTAHFCTHKNRYPESKMSSTFIKYFF